MKKYFINTILILSFPMIIFSQSLNVYKYDGTTYNFSISDIDSITFSGASNISTEGLVAYYPFNGNVNDESGNGNNGVVYGAEYDIDRFGMMGKSMYFDGNASAYVEFPNSPSLQSPTTSVSICAWMMDGITINKSNTSSTPQYGMLCYLTEVAFRAKQILDYPYFISQEYTFTPGTWYFVAVVYDNINVYYYVNGENIGFSPLTGIPDVDTSPLTIGIDTPGATEYITGKVDDVRIYNRAISESEIKTLYHENGW